MKRTVSAFNYLTRNDIENMYCNQQFPFCNRADYTADQIALNGVLHPLELPLAIVQHTAGRIRMNLYGGTERSPGISEECVCGSAGFGSGKLYYFQLSSGDDGTLL